MADNIAAQWVLLAKRRPSARRRRHLAARRYQHHQFRLFRPQCGLQSSICGNFLIIVHHWKLTQSYHHTRAFAYWHIMSSVFKVEIMQNNGVIQIIIIFYINVYTVYITLFNHSHIHLHIY